MSDILTADEADYVRSIWSKFPESKAYQEIKKVISRNGGISASNKDHLLELRIAHALLSSGVELAYEVSGEGGSRIDLGFDTGPIAWNVEVFRLNETDALKLATKTRTMPDGITWTSQVLRDPRYPEDDPTQSVAGETLKVIERICQKLERGGRARKFSNAGATINVLLVDTRTFLNGGDALDYIQIALGGALVAQRERLYFKGNLLRGVFDPGNNQKGAKNARERLHFIGFLRDKLYDSRSIAAGTTFIANHNIFQDYERARSTITHWPLQPVHLV